MSKPDLSVIIASCVGPPFIDRCLRSLEAQREVANVEFLVPDRAGGETRQTIRSQFPWVTVIERRAGESVPDMRRVAVEVAQADYVAIIEEHCVAAPDWIAHLLECVRSGPACVGGPVADNDYERLMDWVVYFTEYNSYLPPGKNGPTWNICAANCVYRRDLILRYLPERGSGYWEAVVNGKLIEAGHELIWDSCLIVRHTGPFGFFYYLGQRFLFSRAFAGVRRREVPIWYRGAYVLLAPLLVPLLWARTAKRIIDNGHRVGKLLKVLPHMVPVTCVYVAGEWIGYLFGPGDALARIE